MNITPNQKIVLCVGELLPNKNQKMSILAVKNVIRKYPDVLLLFAGNGPEKENLEKMIKENRLEKHIDFLGYITNLQEYQQVADIAISCSKREGLPLNIVEAMLSKTPVIASNNRGHRELICDKKNGFLVDVDDYKEMAKRILFLLDENVVYREIQSSAEAYAMDYTFTNVKKELMKVYELKDE